MCERGFSKQLAPAFSHLGVRPTGGSIAIELDDDVIVITHDGIGTQINCKYLGKQLHSVNNPLPPVLKVVSGQLILPTQKGSPHAA